MVVGCVGFYTSVLKTDLRSLHVLLYSKHSKADTKKAKPKQRKGQPGHKERLRNGLNFGQLVNLCQIIKKALNFVCLVLCVVLKYSRVVVAQSGI